MRMTALAAAAFVALASPAFAAPASVDISIAPEFQKKIDKTYGAREATLLTGDLREAVEKALARTPAYDGARIELTLVDAKPNRPTFKQLADKPGLSMESFGVGGASIEGRVVAADGTETPVAYKWYETDLRNAYGNWVWSDATWTFDRFARRLARGGELAQR
ncbi:hypothetical protein [Phenylobacterium sp. SCN 70-31]|uniref:hypothetical protein n=1 Tax=Phenylobacterium sp. SCN 70-31 TaxID=1660129 RepID=UPI00086D9C21|nr:hypothetical protein [Phenylobacterium sp. SCN 70-31]ODT88056.1 MAG: hypothetical protein ABS78_09145 [Phenylobacterium sp. SCN 70-31]